MFLILWDNVLEKVLYGKDIEVTYKRDEVISEIYVDNIEKNLIY